MASIAFDTLKYTKRLEAAGFTRVQEEATVFKSELSADFQRLEHKISLDFERLENKLQQDFQRFENKIDNKINNEIAPLKTNIAVIMWMQGLTILTLVVPALKHLLGL